MRRKANKARVMTGSGKSVGERPLGQGVGAVGLVKDFSWEARYPLDLVAAKPVTRRNKCI